MDKIIEETIKRLETIQKRLINCKDQNDNLHKLMQEQFSNNMLFFKQFYPVIYEKFVNFILKNKKIVCFEDGVPNVLDLRNGTLMYEDQIIDCKNQVNDWVTSGGNVLTAELNIQKDEFCQSHFYFSNKLCSFINSTPKSPNNIPIPECIPSIIVVGCGLGFVLEELYSRTAACNMLLVEQDEELFYCSICVFDWARLLQFLLDNNLNIHFILGGTPIQNVRTIENYYSEKYSFLVFRQYVFQHYRSSYNDEFMKILGDTASVLSLTKGMFDDCLFGISHALNNQREIKFLKKDSLKDDYKSMPVIIVGNGPSLDHNIEFLKSIQDKCLIVACGTAYSALIKYGINTHIYVAVERVTCVSDFLAEIEDKKQFDSTLCIAPDIVHPNTINFFKNQLLFLKKTESLDAVFSKVKNNINDFLSLGYINPLVSNCAISLILSMGFTNIWLVGIDCGTANKDEHHSKFSAYFDEEKNLKEKSKNMVLSKNDLVIKGNFIEEVFTNQLFMKSIHNITAAILNNGDDAKVYNASNGAFIEGTIPKHLRDIELTSVNFKPSIVIEDIKNNGSIFFGMTQEQKKLIDDGKFTYNLIDGFIKSWENQFSSREEILKLMQDQTDIIHICYHQNHTMIPILLEGTLSSLFAQFLCLLYSIFEEKTVVDYFNSQKYLIIDFLKIVKQIYPNTEKYIQGKHMKYLPSYIVDNWEKN